MGIDYGLVNCRKDECGPAMQALWSDRGIFDLKQNKEQYWRISSAWKMFSLHPGKNLAKQCGSLWLITWWCMRHFYHPSPQHDAVTSKSERRKKRRRKNLIGACFFESHGQNVSAVNLKVFALQPASSYGDSCNKWLTDVASSLFSINTWLKPAARRAPNAPSLRCHICSPKNKSARVKNALCYRLPRLFVVPLFQSEFPS